MGLTNVAKNALATAAVTGTLSVTEWDSAAYFGVGDSSAAYAATQTDLQAATNKLRKAMDAGFPTNTGGIGVLVYRATYGLTDAVWVWNEWGVFNAAAAGSMLNRCVQSLGTKPNTEIWQVAGTLTFAAG